VDCARSQDWYLRIQNDRPSDAAKNPARLATDEKFLISVARA
jgi:hypothetical protein